MSAPFTPGPWHVADGGVVWVEQPVPVAHQECCGNALPSGECCGNCIEAWHEELAQEQIAQCSPTDAHLIAAAPKMYEALDRAAKRFREYQGLHLSKGTVDGALKAATNRIAAEECEAVLAEARGETL